MSNKAATIQSQKTRQRRLASSPTELVTSLSGSAQVRFRRLKTDEPAMYGDYVENEDSSYRLWEGPTGFRAGSFLNKVYRPVAKGHK
ncbi:MAG: hypothetical protein HY735_07760 [Verrucomicrobia bacterium]|nr:hypothetical protein [Verrucomicrobiota bacterium]